MGNVAFFSDDNPVLPDAPYETGRSVVVTS